MLLAVARSEKGEGGKVGQREIFTLPSSLFTLPCIHAVGDHTLHAHEARALYQHRAVRVQIFVQRGEQVFDALEMARTCPEFMHRMGGQLAQRQ